jgi:hypothetical protein
MKGVPCWATTSDTGVCEKFGDPFHTDEEVSDMKTLTRLSLVIVVGLAAFLPFATAVQAKAVVYYFTGTESCAPTSMGDWTYPDGSIHIRGMIFDCTENSDSPFVAGRNTVVLNANLKAFPGAMLGGIGPMWGTWEMANWEGTFEGVMTADGGIYHAQGRGKGTYTGMKEWLDTDHGVFNGRILDPHGG